MKSLKFDIFFSIGIGFLLSLLFWGISGQLFGHVFPGSLAVTIIGIFLLRLAYEWTDKSAALRWILISGFLLRLGLGLFVTICLPQIGYDEEAQTAGYLFRDAYNRDTQAWQMASSDKPLLEIISDEYAYDQYGGLIVLSTLVYRYLSPAFHNTYLVLFLAAIVSSIGIPFVWAAFQGNKRVQLIAALLYTFYPDAILFSASQMREPFILGLSAILFWLIFTKKNLLKPTILLGLFFLVASLLLISAKIGLFICALALVWFYFDHYAVFQKRISSKKLLLLTAILALGFGLLSLQWILEAGKWDAVLALNSSGWIQEIFKYLPDPFHLPFITIYGLIQPVLPAALVEPSIPFWKTIGIFRSFGWVLLSSLLLYSVVFVIRVKNKDQKKWAAILVLLIFWVVLSSLRAGGDMWDNPRYRLGLMVPISFLSALSVDYAIQFIDHWLWRILAAEFVFNIFFLHWYISRYTNVWGKLDFPVMIALICLIVAAIMGHGIFYEIHSKKLQKDQ